MPPFNGTGVYSLPAGNPVTTGTSVSSTVQNNTLSDIATALTDCVTKDGQSSPTANIPMATFRFTNVGAGVALTDLATLGQAQSDASKWLSGVTGTDTITATVSPVPSAYAAGMSFNFTVAGANTTSAVTLNISSLGAKNVFKNGQSINPGEIPSGVTVRVVYDGTQFQIIGMSKFHFPVRTTAGRDAAATVGFVQYNTTLGQFEGYGVSGWSKLGSGTTGAGTDAAFYENDVLITGNYTLGQSSLISGATITIASPGVVTLNGHGFIAGQLVFFETTGALPTGLSADVGYYVLAAGLATNTFQLGLTDGGAAINTSGTQSGVHSCGKIKNAETAGPISIAAGVTVTIPTGSTWTVV